MVCLEIFLYSSIIYKYIFCYVISNFITGNTLKILSTFGHEIRTILKKISTLSSFNFSSSKSTTEEIALVSNLKMNGLMLDEDKNTNISKCIENKISVQNAITFYQLTKLYKIKCSADIIFNYIERCFPMVAETQNFLEVEFNEFSKILNSSELNIHSELEINNAASSWLRHNSTERSKFAEQLLLTVRLPLLSDHALQYILNESSPLTENSDCVNILKKTSIRKENIFQNKSSKYYTSRYCNQTKYNILICGGMNNECKTVSNVKQIDGKDLNNVKVLPSMTNVRYDSEVVWLKGDVYIFGGYDNNGWLKSVEKYSHSTNTWNIVAYMYNNRRCFCACSCMESISVIGGCYYANGKWPIVTNSCLQFDTKNNNWKEITAMNEARKYAACTVFEGKIVVSGGMDDNHNIFNTVESYDVIADQWSSMPNMIDGKCGHSLVVVRNKLFVIGYGSDTCEVFESRSNKFVALKSPPVDFVELNKAIAIGSKILVFQNDTTTVHCYDVDKNEWSEESCEVTRNLGSFSCVKLAL